MTTDSKPTKMTLTACGEDAADVEFAFVSDKGGAFVEVRSGGRVVASLTREYAQAVAAFVGHHAPRATSVAMYCGSAAETRAAVAELAPWVEPDVDEWLDYLMEGRG